MEILFQWALAWPNSYAYSYLSTFYFKMTVLKILCSHDQNSGLYISSVNNTDNKPRVLKQHLKLFL